MGGSPLAPEPPKGQWRVLLVPWSNPPGPRGVVAALAQPGWRSPGGRPGGGAGLTGLPPPDEDLLQRQESADHV